MEQEEEGKELVPIPSSKYKHRLLNATSSGFNSAVGAVKEGAKGVYNTSRQAAKIGYNSTLGELRNLRIPIADTLRRTFDTKVYDPGKKYVFDTNEHYYRLGGKRTRKNKKASKKRKTVNKRRKSKKH